MSASSVPISGSSHQLLKQLAAQTSKSTMEVLDEALRSYQRQLFFSRTNAGYAELRSNPEAWAEHLAEREAWENTLSDGLDSTERWTDDGPALPDQP